MVKYTVEWFPEIAQENLSTIELYDFQQTDLEMQIWTLCPQCPGMFLFYSVAPLITFDKQWSQTDSEVNMSMMCMVNWLCIKAN